MVVEKTFAPVENPIRALRKAKGLTLYQMAALMDISYTTVAQAESGGLLQLSARFRQGLVAMGVKDPDEMNREYRRWRQVELVAMAQAVVNG